MEKANSRERRTILLVEDDESLRLGLSDLLVFHGFAIDAVGGLEPARTLLKTRVYDLVILDLMLPDGEGFNLGAELRAQDPDCILLFLTARDAEDDKIRGLSLGADDYITKPFSSRELVLRVTNILRRSHKLPQANQIVAIADIQIDTATCMMTRPSVQSPIKLSKREVGILVYLNSCRPGAASRADILRNVWGYSRSKNIETRTVDIHIAKLRRKIELDPKTPQLLVTDRGDGYRLSVEGQ